MSGTPYPGQGQYLQAIRQSAKTLRQSAGIHITAESIGRLIYSATFTSSFRRVSNQHGLSFPLRFSSVLDELNFLSVLSLLNFGSGYRIPLHKETGRGAWDNVRALAFSLYLASSTGEGDLLSAKGLQTITETQISEFMRVNMHREQPHPEIPGIVVGQLGGPMYELVKLIAKSLNETGSILLSSGYLNLGSFVLEALKEGGGARKVSNKPDPVVEVVLERLVKAFPAFRDMAEVDGYPVYCFKKALFLIHAIAIRFGSTTPAPFPIPVTSDLPVFTDNVLPSILVHLGVIDISGAPQLAGVFPDANETVRIGGLLGEPPVLGSASPSNRKPTLHEGPILTSDQAYILRAAAINACEMIVDYIRSERREEGKEVEEWIKDITLPKLDMWIWAVAKDRVDYRKLGRFVLHETVFF